jgi:type IV secretion system protein VirB11
MDPGDNVSSDEAKVSLPTGGASPQPTDHPRDAVRARRIDFLRHQLGPDIGQWLFDPTVTDIILNADGKLWVNRLGEPSFCAGTMEAGRAEALIALIAGTLDTVVTRERPLVQGVLALDGSRFQGLVPPVVAAPAFAIRRKASAVFTLAQYVARGQMRPAQQARIEHAVRARENIVVTGGTGSGKTTLLNGVIKAIADLTPEHRILVCEDTAELQVGVANTTVMQTTDTVSMTQLIRTALRLFPDRILVGEVRGPEALDMIDAWNTGHPGGMCSIHSNIAHPQSALMRLEGLLSRSRDCPANPQRLIGEAVDLVICIERTPDHGRRIAQIVSVQGWNGHAYQLQSETE